MSGNAATYLKKFQAGRCQACPNPIEPGHWRCGKCLGRLATTVATSRLKRLAAGLCVNAGCGNPRGDKTRCKECLKKASIYAKQNAHKFPSRKSKPAKAKVQSMTLALQTTATSHNPLCRHCGSRKVNRPRGLCWKCFYCPGVRAMYEPMTAAGRAGARGHDEEAEPTMEELEALIAEQSKPENLPSWWHSDCRAMNGGRRI